MASGDVSPQPDLVIELVAAVTGYTDTPAGHATYSVSCKVSAEGAGRWRSSVLVERRFKEFDKLHSALAPLLPLPKEFPVEKTPFINEQIKLQRVERLGAYLQTVVAAAGTTPPPPLLRFLGVDLTKLHEAAASNSSTSSLATVVMAFDDDDADGMKMRLARPCALSPMPAVRPVRAVEPIFTRWVRRPVTRAAGALLPPLVDTAELLGGRMYEVYVAVLSIWLRVLTALALRRRTEEPLVSSEDEAKGEEEEEEPAIETTKGSGAGGLLINVVGVGIAYAQVMIAASRVGFAVLLAGADVARDGLGKSPK